MTSKRIRFKVASVLTICVFIPQQLFAALPLTLEKSVQSENQISVADSFRPTPSDASSRSDIPRVTSTDFLHQSMTLSAAPPETILANGTNRDYSEPVIPEIFYLPEAGIRV